MGTHIIPHKFHIVTESFGIPLNGIIGKDFIRKFKCQIDYLHRSFTINLENNTITMPMHDQPINQNLITIPSRCEVITAIHLDTTEDVVIQNEEIAPNVFIASTIINSISPYVRILNLNDVSKTVEQKIKYSPLNDFNVVQFDKHKDENRVNKIFELIKPNHPKNVPDALFNLCREYNDIFSLDSDKMSTNNFYTQTLKLKDSDPVFTKNYRLPHSQKAEIEKQVINLLDNEAIEPSISAYNSPIILVPKKSTNGEKKFRMCIDYRKLNQKLIPDKHPLPRIDEVLEGLGNAKFFSVIDLSSGFHQIPISRESRNVTSFSTSAGAYQWKVLPFGLNISPNSFSRMMSIAFAGLTPSTCFLYMDDIVVIGKSINHHIKNLTKVFHTCRKFNLKINPSKCQFFRHEVTYLGHKCTSAGILPDNSKLDSVANYPIPKNKDEVKRLVAFANFYRRFIQDFSVTCKVLNNLTRKSTEFVWTNKCQKAFEKLKTALINPPVLAYPDFNRPFILTVDASKQGCGAVLSQNWDGNDLPIAFASKAFTIAESKKAPIEFELIAINWSIKHFRAYLYGTRFLVRSDHKPLVYLYSLKDPSSRLTRLRLELEEYDFIIEHIKGKENVVADALSRISFKNIQETANEINPTINVHAITRSMNRKANKIVEKSPRHEIKEMPENVRIYEALNMNEDKHIPTLMCDENKSNQTGQISIKFKLLLKRGKKPLCSFEIPLTNVDTLIKKGLTKLNHVAGYGKIDKIQIIKNNFLFKLIKIEKFKEMGKEILKNVRIVIKDSPIIIHDENERTKIIQKYHENALVGGHTGRNRLYAKIKAKYHWKGIARDISKYIKSCHSCQISKPKTYNVEPLTITQTSHKAGDRIIIDTIGPLRKSDNQNQYALTIVCDLTKFLVMIPLKNKEAISIAKALFENFILTFGPPSSILSDRGTEYVNKIMDELTTLTGIKHDKSTPYRPQTLGAIERTHRVFNEYLRSYLTNQPCWETNMNYFQFCYNITPHSSFKNRYSPYELMFGKQVNDLEIINNDVIDPLYNIDNYALEFRYRLQTAYKNAINLLIESKNKNKEFFDKKCNPLNIAIGDKVILVAEGKTKHEPLYKGPFQVTKIMDTNVEILDINNNKSKIVHKNNIRKYLA